MAADVYLRSTDGNNADDGSTWALADATLAASLTAAGSGGRSFMSDNHAETQASAMTLASPGTAASPTMAICVDDAGDPQPPTALATTGSVSTTGASDIAHTGFVEGYGFTENVADGSNLGSSNFINTSAWAWHYRSATLVLRGTHASSRIVVGNSGNNVGSSQLRLWACDAQFNATSQAFNAPGRLQWWGGTLTLGIAPTNGLVRPLNASTTQFQGRGLDLANLGSNPLFNVGDVAQMLGFCDFVNCKFGATPVTSTGTWPPGPSRVRVHNGSANDIHYYLAEECYEGSIRVETNAVRASGASDGITPISHKLVTTADAEFYSPLWTPRYAVLIDTPGTYTLTLHFIHDSATALHDGDIWPELEYAGTSGFPLSLFQSGQRPILPTTTTDWGSSTATWSGSAVVGMANANKQKLTVTVTSQEIGVWQVRVAVAKASYTVYLDPLLRASVV